MAVQNPPTSRLAIIVGGVCIAAGIMPILSGLGLVAVQPIDGTPGWITVCAGGVFVLGGAALINGYVFGGGTTPDGDLPPNTPFGVLLAQYVLGLGMVALLTAVTGWVAVGPGGRSFSTSVDVPFASRQSSASEITGRIAFGVSTVVMAAFFVGLVFKAARQLSRAHHASRDI
jgi:hypothetical protein